MSVETISRGLGSVGAYDGPNSFPLTNLKDGPNTIGALRDLAELAGNVHGRLLKRINLLTNDLKGETERVREHYRDEPDMSDSEKAKRSQIRLSGFRKDILKKSSEDRYAAIRELQELERKATATAEIFGSPVTILAQSGFGTDQRSTYLAQMQNSGPAELDNFARLAVAKGDAVLAAAVASKIDSLPDDKRKGLKISKQALADAVVGETYQAAQSALAVVRNRLNEAIRANRDVESGKATNGALALQEALARRDEMEEETSED